MTKDKLRHINLLFAMHLDRYAFAIVPDCDPASFSVNRHLDHCHLLVSVVVVRRIDDDLICTRPNQSATPNASLTQIYLPKIL